MKPISENEKILLEWYLITDSLLESDKGIAKGNIVTTQSGNAGKSSSFTAAKSQQSGTGELGSNVNKEDAEFNKGVNKDGKSASTKNYKTLSTDKERDISKKLEKNKEITKSIEKLDKPKDVASLLQGILQTTVKDGNAKEQEVKNAVSLFARETLKKK